MIIERHVAKKDERCSFCDKKIYEGDSFYKIGYVTFRTNAILNTCESCKKELITKLQIVGEVPKSCSKCKHYSTTEYRCHNERGLECNCSLGFMRGYDMRDQNYWLENHRFEGCGLHAD